jgi:hypothetical protein
MMPWPQGLISDIAKVVIITDRRRQFFGVRKLVLARALTKWDSAWRLADPSQTWTISSGTSSGDDAAAARGFGVQLHELMRAPARARP